MRRSKKIILIALLAIVVLAGSIGGVVLAQTENGDDSQPKTRYGALLDKVCEIYNTANPEAPINCEELHKAFTQAGSALRDEARNQLRQRLIDEGKVTQEQLDEYDAWMASKPDVPFAAGPRGHFGHRGFGAFGGGFRSWCEPQTPTE